MNTKEILCFIRCYKERSINKAAKQLFITPQGLSKIIQNLENEFHTPLFVRTKTGITPTEGGEVFYQHCTQLLEKMEEIENLMLRFKDKGKIIHIGFASGVLQVFSLQALRDYQHKHPDIKIIWEESANRDIKDKLQKDALDIAFIIDPIGDSDFCEEELFSTRTQ